MPAYAFEAVDAEGATRKGVLEADTARSARSMLRAQALVPLSVEPVGSGQGVGEAPPRSRGLFAGRVFRGTALAVWTRQISGLVSAGLPLERARTALTE